MDFVINNLPIIICAVLGIGLIIVELFTPGFGVPGASGILLLLASIVLTWMQYGPLAGLGATVVVLAVCAFAATTLLKSAKTGRISRSALILRDTMSRDEGYKTTDGYEKFLAREGTAVTALRPAGIAEFDGTRLDVVSGGEYIEIGARVRVMEAEGARVLVRRVQA